MVAGSHSSAWPKEDYPKVYWSVLCCCSLVLWKQPTTKIVLWPLGLLAPKIPSSFEMPLTQEARHRESLSSTQPPHLSWWGAAKYLCWGNISQELPGIEVVGFVVKYLTLVWKTRACKTQEELWQLLPLLYAPAKLLHEDNFNKCTRLWYKQLGTCAADSNVANAIPFETHWQSITVWQPQLYVRQQLENAMIPTLCSVLLLEGANLFSGHTPIQRFWQGSRGCQSVKVVNSNSRWRMTECFQHSFLTGI